uniref:Secreted protein n=1 Tax=Steinernema glaseri TaxID=37863 RepID=A0A1I7YCE3_9BILA
MLVTITFTFFGVLFFVLYKKYGKRSTRVEDSVQYMTKYPVYVVEDMFIDYIDAEDYYPTRPERYVKAPATVKKQPKPLMTLSPAEFPTHPHQLV